MHLTLELGTRKAQKLTQGELVLAWHSSQCQQGSEHWVQAPVPPLWAQTTRLEKYLHPVQNIPFRAL